MRNKCFLFQESSKLDENFITFPELLRKQTESDSGLTNRRSYYICTGATSWMVRYDRCRNPLFRQIIGYA